MSDMGLLEVCVKSVKSLTDDELEYETAVDLSNCSWTDTKYVLHVNIYEGFFIEINTTDMVTHYSEMWPEENYAIHASQREPKHSYSIHGVVYDKGYYDSLNVDHNCLRGIVDAVNARESKVVMIPFPQAEISRLFDQAFNVYLKNKIHAWKRETAA